MNLSTIFGLLIGIGCILLGHIMGGGHVASLVDFAALFIVFGGTLGAVLISNPLGNIKVGLELVKSCFVTEDEKELAALARKLEATALEVRKESILSIEKKLPQFDPFMKNVFRYVVDGVDGSKIRDTFEHQILEEEEHQLQGAKIWSEAGGFAPTIGILGAVLGLIHVMGNLTDTAELGRGIAVAFVATIYGVGSANLIFLPLSNKIKKHIEQKSIRKRMIVEGAASIAGNLNPYLTKERIRAFDFSNPPAI